MNLEDITLSEISQTQKHILCDLIKAELLEAEYGGCQRAGVSEMVKLRAVVQGVQSLSYTGGISSGDLMHMMTIVNDTFCTGF